MNDFAMVSYFAINFPQHLIHRENKPQPLTQKFSSMQLSES